jgi:transcriptional regulator with XRE-family HTH domain
MQDLQRRLGERVRKLRLKRGWSQEGFADACGLHRTYVGSVERGERNITLSSLHTLARTLGITLSEMLRGLDKGLG